MNGYSAVYRFADIAVKINFLHEEFSKMSENWLCGEPPEMEITVTEKDIRAEKERAEDGEKYSDGYVETLAIYRKFCTLATEYKVMLFHSSAVAVDGEAYLFSAPSGTGKSTHAALWRRVLGERAKMINDDKPLLRFKEGGVFVYGTPWNGKHRLGGNFSCRLKAVCFLERGASNSIRSVSPSEGLPRVLAQTYLPDSPVECERALKMAGKISHDVPLYLLACNISEEAALLSYNTMKQGKRV